MTLLSICQNAAKSTGIDAPGTIVGNTDPTAVRLLALAGMAGTSIHRRYPWTVLQREHTFTTSVSDNEYDLPTDFHRFIGETAWDRDAYWQMRGPLSPQEWQIAKSGLAASAQLRKRYRVKRASTGNSVSFFIDPTPASSDDLVFEYISKNWCAAAGGTAQSDWAVDTDVGIVDEYLIELELRWRVMERLGLSYAEAKDEADREIDKAWARDGDAAVLPLSESDWQLPPLNIVETGFG